VRLNRAPIRRAGYRRFVAWIDPNWPEVSKEDMKRWAGQPLPDTPANRSVQGVGIIAGLLGLVIVIAALVIVANAVV
jgi:hypothetical protein